MPTTALIPAHVPPALVIYFDFRNDEALRRDPWTYLASMNDKPDIFYSPDLGGYWVVTRGSLIEDVFSRHDLFTATSLAIPKLENPLLLIPNRMDPPEHTKYRKVLAQNLFSPRALGTLEEDTRQFTRALLGSFAPGRCEFVSEFAYKLPIDIFLLMMGMDPARRDDCIPWVKDIFRGKTREETERGFGAAHVFISAWLTAQLKDPSANTGKMFQAMIASKVDGRALTYDEMFAITLMLFSGGLDTVTSQMTHFMKFLAENPAHRDYLTENPGAIPRAQEELLRRFGISFIGRMAAKDFTYHGVSFKAGDPVVAATPIAGLDRLAFEDPISVDFNRDGGKVRHLAFGAGPHLCIGAYLARTQLRVMLEELLPAMPGLHLDAGATIETLPGATLMLKALPLRWHAT